MNNVLLATYPDRDPGGVVNPLLGNSVRSLQGSVFASSLLSTVVASAVMIGGIVFIGMLIVGAYNWMTAGGDKSQLEGARSRISSALIGLVVLLAIIALVKLMETVFSISILSINLEPLRIGP